MSSESEEQRLAQHAFDHLMREDERLLLNPDYTVFCRVVAKGTAFMAEIVYSVHLKGVQTWWTPTNTVDLPQVVLLLSDLIQTARQAAHTN